MTADGHPGMDTARHAVLIAGAAIAVWSLVGSIGAGWIAAAVAAGSVAAILAVPLDGRMVVGHLICAVRLAIGRSGGRGGSADRTILEIESGGHPIGVVWNGSELSIVGELHPSAPGGRTTIGADGVSPDRRLPLDDLVACIARSTEASIGLGVCSVGIRPVTGRRAAEAYSTMAGPSASIAFRRTWLVLSVDVADGEVAASRRGGGPEGAAQMLVMWMSRLRHILRAASIDVTIMDRSGIEDADLATTQGIPRRHLRQKWSTVSLGGTAWAGRRVDPRWWTAETMNEVSDIPGSSTSVAIRVETDTGGVAASLTYGCSGPDSARAVKNSRVSRSVTMNGLLLRTLDSVLPSTARGSLPRRPVERSALGRLVVPITGCGQIVGVDAEGAGVAIGLYGPGIDSVLVRGELYLVHQIVFRAVAVGARVQVLTDRHHAWRHLASAVADSGALTVGLPSEDAAADPSTDLIVADHAVDRPVYGTATVLRVSGSGRGGRADIVVDQPGDAGDRITVTTGDERLSLRLVTTAAETDVIGRPRLVSRSRVHERG